MGEEGSLPFFTSARERSCISAFFVTRLGQECRSIEDAGVLKTMVRLSTGTAVFKAPSLASLRDGLAGHWWSYLTLVAVFMYLHLVFTGAFVYTLIRFQSLLQLLN